MKKHNVFIHRFCATRWIEDEAVSERALKLWPNIMKVIKHWESLSKSKRPQNKSYETLTKHYTDKFILAKLQFFKDIATLLKEFLEKFQTDNPMVPFLEEALTDVIRKLMKIIVKPEILIDISTSIKLAKVDLSKMENLLPYELLKFPTATKALLKEKGLT